MKIQVKQTEIVWLAALLLLSVVANAQERGSITGRIVTEDGKPLSNVRVSISTNGADRSRAISRSTTTDAEGNFELKNLPDRNYDLSYSVGGGYTLKLPVPEGHRTSRLRPGDSTTITMMRGGVITGRVTNPNGEPLVGITVNAVRVRDHEDRKINASSGGPPRTTDDRGMYRLYGLQPGTYIVAANSGPSFATPALSPYYGEMPTYHPSSTRDTAAEVKVTSGSEATDIDIRYRGETGHIVSGKVSGGESAEANSGTSVSLRHALTGAAIGNAFVAQGQSEPGFAIQGVPDGEYELTANRGGSDSDEIYYSEPRRLTVKGADVTGINLRLTPTATVAGHVTVEKSPAVCDAKLKTSLEDLTVAVRRDESGEPAASATRIIFSRSIPPDEKGDFKISGIIPGRYRLQAGLPNETWFTKSITGPAPVGSPGRPTATKSVLLSDLTRGSLLLKPGEKYSGATVTITDGGASLRGKAVPSQQGGKLPQRLQVHLIPAELTAVNETLRFAERLVGRDGSFAFPNIVPGKYWLLTRVLPDSEPTERPPQPAAWDGAERAKLRKDAEAAKHEIELKACQRVKDHVLQF